MGCFLLKHTMFILRLIQALTLGLDHLGPDHNALWLQMLHHIPYSQWYVLFQFSHHIDEDSLIFCYWLDCDDAVRVYHEGFRLPGA